MKGSDDTNSSEWCLCFIYCGHVEERVCEDNYDSEAGPGYGGSAWDVTRLHSDAATQESLYI